MSALQISGEGDRTVSPEAGDPVSFQMEGEVTRVEGDMVYLTPTTANGEPIPPPGDKQGYEPVEIKPGGGMEMEGMEEIAM